MRVSYEVNGVQRYAYVVGYLPRGLMVDREGSVEYVPSYMVTREDLREVL